MKTIINKLRYTLLLGFIALAALGNSLNALELTVCDGNVTDANLPVWAYNYDTYFQINQMIYPAEMLTPIVGKPITKITFYANAAIERLANNGGGAFNVKLGTTSNTQFGQTPSRITGLTTVASTNMSSYSGSSQIEITLDGSGYTYNGGNLVIEFNVTSTGSWQSLSFYGITQQNASYYSTSSNQNGTYSPTRKSFLPKVTFNYTSFDPTIEASPGELTFSVIPGTTQTEQVAVTGLNLTGDITATLNDANGVFSVTPTSLGTSGGNLTISYSPSALGSHSATLTLSSAGAEPVTITLNGTCTEDLTICNGTGTDEYLPIYGYYYDNYQKNQMIYPENMVGALSGRLITSMTFYATRDFNFSGGELTVRLATTDQTSYSGKVRLEPADMAIVKSGFDVPSSGNTWTIVFDTPFEYNGGNLVVDFEETNHGSGTGSYSSGFSFYGVRQTGGGFCSYGSTYNSTFSSVYSNGTVRNFLPKVTFTSEANTPITDGTVTPNAVDFGTVVVGETATQTVSIKNTGNQPFTPVIDVTGLPEGITVSPTTSGELAGHGTLNLTVTFEPTADGEYSGSFTVTIPIPDGEDLVFTVDVTGSAYEVSSKLTSNMVEIPVYKSDVNPNAPNGYPYIFSQNDVENDIDMGLSYDDVSDGVSILVKSDEQITGYDLKHKPANGNTWSSVGTAAHQGNSYVAGETTMSFGQDETEMWFPMDDQQEEAYDYVPVTVANSIVAGGTQGNTYGAPIRTKNVDNVTLEVIVGGSKSDQRPYGSWVTDGVDYCVYTPVIMISSEALNGDTHIPFMFRAWLLSDDVIYDFERNTTNGHIVGTDPIDLPYCLGTFEVDQTAIGQTTFTIGRDWVEPEGEDNPNDWNTKLENAFGAPSENADIRIVVRAYYTRATRDGNGYAFSEGEGDGDGISTWVMELNSDRQVVGVTYVNPMGMTSDRPFEGMNIIVTRYSDGSCRTSKVMF